MNNHPHKTNLARAGITGLTFAAASVATTLAETGTIFSYNTTNRSGNYATYDRPFSAGGRTAVKTGTGTAEDPYVYTNAFSDTTPMTPPATQWFWGPSVYGGYKLTTTAPDTAITEKIYRSYGDAPLISLSRTGAWAGYTLRASGVMLFKQADFSDDFNSAPVTVSGFTATVSQSGASMANNLTGRWLVQINDIYYLSNITTAIPTNGGAISLTGTTLGNAKWAAYDPSENLVFDNSAATFSTLALENVTAVGIYFSGSVANGAYNTGFSFALRNFTVEGDLYVPNVPEPGAAALWLGGLLLVATTTIRATRSHSRLRRQNR
ncbi:MAG: hypothetical protein LBK99_09760 [Opitutaceae bacterium]|jgi:hypothetical protein|nr:hypothetical protein [Opitutaceae bacterium]